MQILDEEQVATKEMHEDPLSMVPPDGEFHHFISFNGNIYIDGFFHSGEYEERQAALAFDLYFEKMVREVVEEVTGKEVVIAE